MPWICWIIWARAGAHIVGLSMGGMIAQHVAMSPAQRAFSLTSIMSSTGNPELPRRDEALMAFLAPLGAADTEAAVAAQNSGLSGDWQRALRLR